jgi:hypothetical protein
MKNIKTFKLLQKLSDIKKRMESDAFKQYESGLITSVELANRILYINNKSFKIYKYGCKLENFKIYDESGAPLT